MVERITIDVPTPPGGWAPPWPNVVEIEAVLPHEKWTLVDVLIADHRAPRVIERLRGRSMVRIEGGTQALKRTVNARLEMAPGHVTTISVPSPFGATVLKAAAYLADSRDKERHLQDAVLLLAVIDDPHAERAGFAGSDHQRLLALARALPDDAREWRTVPEP